MAINPSISEQLERQSVVAMECTIPGEMTIGQWRSMRPRRKPGRSARLFAGARRVVPLRPVTCDHLCETTTRYDKQQKQLTFLLACPACGTVKVMQTIRYEPRFDPTPAPRSPDAPDSATVHVLPVRGTEWRVSRRAA
jgi:hypothetical protein